MKQHNTSEGFCPIIYHEKVERPMVDEWVPAEEDKMFITVKGAIISDVASMYGLDDGNINNNLNYFNMKSKRSYNSVKVRDHIVHYLNYFNKFYDYDHELYSIYSTIKYLIDYEPTYSKDAFFYDLKRYIIYGTISVKADYMNRDNYSLSLTYRNKKNPVLQYLDKHALLLMKISLLMNMMAPLLCHYMTQRQIKNTNEFLLEIYDELMHIDPDIDIYSKLYETAETNVSKSAKNNPAIFAKQDIRGVSVATHTIGCVNNIIINIIIKYRYDSNIIHLNFKSIHKNTGFQILDIEYEFAFYPLSSSNRDADMNSDFDRFESFLQKADSALYMQNKVACEASMRMIEMLFGPFEEDEVKYYLRKLSDNNHMAVNSFQKDLVFNLFYKYFGDTATLNMITIYDYVKLIIAARRILENSGMVLLPYIVSSKVVRIAQRKNINKKELTKLELSPLYQYAKDKYKNEKIIKHIFSLIATTMSSDFEYINPDEDEDDGFKISIIPELVIEEILMYITLI